MPFSTCHIISGSMGRGRGMDDAIPGSLQPSRITRLNSSFVFADLSTCKIPNPTSSLVTCLFPSSSRWRFSNSVMYRTRQSIIGTMTRFSASYASYVTLLTAAGGGQTQSKHGWRENEWQPLSSICLLSLCGVGVFLCE